MSVSQFLLIAFWFFRTLELVIYVAEGFRVFTDDVNKFQISIPQGEYPLWIGMY